MTQPKQVQILVCRINRSIMNSMYVEVTHFLHPKPVSSNFLQVYDTLILNSLDSLVIQPFPTLCLKHLCVFYSVYHNDF